MSKAPAKSIRLRPTKEVSVMAWIEDTEQNILLVRQTAGFKLWSLPGGKVKRGESLLKALKREVYEETALRVKIGSLLGIFDRRDKDAITLLFAAVPAKPSTKVKQRKKEIGESGYRQSLPKKATPTAKYFWSARRDQVKKTLKAEASKKPGREASLSHRQGIIVTEEMISKLREATRYVRPRTEL